MPGPSWIARSLLRKQSQPNPRLKTNPNPSGACGMFSVSGLGSHWESSRALSPKPPTRSLLQARCGPSA